MDGKNVKNLPYNTTQCNAFPKEHFDFVVVGTGPCGLAFVDRTFKNKPDAKILMLERGGPDITQEFYPWHLSDTTKHSQNGSGNFLKGIWAGFGGRSTVWTGWCPRPTRDELPGWSDELVERCEKYFHAAEDLLGVVDANDDERLKPRFGHLQRQLFNHIGKNMSDIPSLYRMIPAPLALSYSGKTRQQDTFSTVDRLFELCNSKGEGTLSILLRCFVEKINFAKGTAISLKTSLGKLPLKNSKLILAMGAIPPTTLLVNSLPSLSNAGTNISAHFMSKIMLRVDVRDLPRELDTNGDELEFAALYMAGNHQNNMDNQFHLQLSALKGSTMIHNDGRMTSVGEGGSDEGRVQFAPAHRLLRYIERNGECCEQGYVVFYCSGIGEVDVKNDHNSIKRNHSHNRDDDNNNNNKQNDDTTSNLELSLSLSQKDYEVWQSMDDTMFRVIEQTLTTSPTTLEYWHGSETEGGWGMGRPRVGDYRHPGMVHPCSTLMIGHKAGDGSVVDMNYRPHGVDNVYVTGSGLFPTAGSWNPTLMMTALSLHLSDSVAVKEGVCGNANSKGPNPKGPNPKGPNPKGPN